LGGGGVTREAFSGQRTKDLSGVSLIALKTGFGCYCKNNCYFFFTIFLSGCISEFM
jgi:hypothetical protein